MQKDLFEQKSKNWDMNSKRVESAKAITDNILKNINLDKEMHIMDFGAGTGLLSYFISHKVGKVTAIDTSPSMLKVFNEKAELFECPTSVLELNLVHDEIEEKIEFDGIISSMTLHHIEDIKDILSKFYNLLPENGFIALADLDTEDGTFHSSNEGVFHFGFERDTLESIALEVGFKEINLLTTNTINKPHGSFNIFLLLAKK